MKSMTGFGRSSNSQRANSQAPAKSARKSSVRGARSRVEVREPEINVSIKAVNGRFLELRIHLPREYSDFESELRADLAKIFARGTVDVYINRSRSSASDASVVVNEGLAEAWIRGYQSLAKSLKLSMDVSFETVAQIPDIFTVETSSEVSDQEKKRVKKLVLEAATACDEERVREGESLEKELGSFCGRLEELAGEAQNLKAQAVQELEKRFKQRLDEFLKKRGFDGIDEQRIAQEIVIHLDRADISEELTRLKEHLRAYRQLLKSPEPQGKKLDFYAQELLREINTIGSKSHIAKLTNLVVEAKTVVEKIRELVQNVE